MKFIPYTILLLWTLLYGSDKYFDNHACQECHEKIYEEYQHSAHAKSYFNDELHRKIAQKAEPHTYTCARCHMPMADNLDDLMTGKAKPNPNNKTHTDGVSCYFCHTIAYVKRSHAFNINTSARQAENYKPTLYGGLKNPDKSDKHSSSKSPIYAKVVCTGCHAHKLNDYNVTVFRAMDKDQDSQPCIRCHMPQLSGGAEKINKRARAMHVSHKFLGIYDASFRATGLDINISIKPDRRGITVHLHNKMGHPLIIQPARVKYLKLSILRQGETLWQNYDKHPSEDHDAYFEYSYQDAQGKKIIIPATATSVKMNNLETNTTKTLHYKTPPLKKGDIIHATMYVRLAKEDCQAVVSLKDELFTKEFLLKEANLTVL